MNKILVDGYVLLPPEKGAGGAGRYLHSLLTEWNRTKQNIRIISSIHNYGLFKDYKNLEVAVAHENQTWAYHPHFEWADVFYAPLNGLWPRVIPSSLPVVSCIHDLQHLVTPQFFKPEMWSARNHDYGFAIKRSDRLIAISDFEKQNLIKFYGKREIDVVHHSGYLADHWIEASKLSEIENRIDKRQYAIYPAVPWPHKNHESLLYAWALYSKLHAGKELLVLTGAMEHGHAAANLNKLVTDLGLENNVVVAGFQKDDVQARLIKNAKALLFPSLYEGFGIPIVEAMALGTPVCASRQEAIHEVGQDAIMYFEDSKNPIAMANDIRGFLQDDEVLQKYTKAGIIRASAFSTGKMAEETSNALNKAVDQKRTRQNSRPLYLENLPPYQSTETLSTYFFFEGGGKQDIDIDLESLEKKVGLVHTFSNQIYILTPASASEKLIEVVSELSKRFRVSVRIYDDQEAFPYAVAISSTSKIDRPCKYILIANGDTPIASENSIHAVISELEYFKDIGGALFDAELPFSQIMRPEKESVAYKNFLKHKRNPIKPFLGAVIRSEMLSSAGVPGSTEFLSYFLRNVSYLASPGGQEEIV